MSIKLVKVTDQGEDFAIILAKDEDDAAKMMSALSDAGDGESMIDVTVENPDDFQEVLARLGGGEDEEEDEEAEEDED
jgi:hypothetical protein